jgi:hypothetical protein
MLRSGVTIVTVDTAGITLASGKTLGIGTGTLALNTTGAITVPNATDTLVGKATTDTLTNKTIAAGSNTITGLTNSNLSGSAGITIANGGTGAATKTAAFDALSPMSASGDLIYGAASGTGTRLAKGADGTYLTLASGVPTWGAATFTTTNPTRQKFTSTGTTAGRIFTITAGNATVGATYTNNGQTFTVLSTIAAGTTLFASGAGTPLASGTLTKASGTGDATLTFSASIATAAYTTPANVKWLRVRLCAAGSGGTGSGLAAGTNSTAGGPTYFGADLLKAIGGGAVTGGYNPGGAGGTGGSIGAGATGDITAGQAGDTGQYTATGNQYLNSGRGGSNAFQGGGAAVGNAGTGIAGTANTGGGGSGGGGFITAGAVSGSGGGAGEYIEAIISNPLTINGGVMYYAVGTGGAAGGAGTGGTAGGAGAAGVIIVEEYYQ